MLHSILNMRRKGVQSVVPIDNIRPHAQVCQFCQKHCDIHDFHAFACSRLVSGVLNILHENAVGGREVDGDTTLCSMTALPIAELDCPNQSVLLFRLISLGLSFYFMME